MAKDLIIPIKLDVAGFIAEMKGFAGKLDELIVKADGLADAMHDLYCERHRSHRWEDCDQFAELAALIAEIRPVVAKAKALDRG